MVEISDTKLLYSDILQIERTQRFKNWTLCPAQNNYIDIQSIFDTKQHQSCVPQQIKTDLFCFDYAMNAQSGDLYVYAYLKTGENYEKIRIQVQNFEIFVNVQINYAIFDSWVQCNEYIQELQVESKNKFQAETVSDLVLSSTPINQKIFKGFVNTNSKHEFSHIQYKFRQFSDYDKFKYVLCQVNNKFAQFMREGVFTCRTNKELFQRAKNSGLLNPIYKMSEDDITKNYICKLQRQYGFLLSGWNNMHLVNIQRKQDRLQAQCDIQTIKPAVPSQQIPLTLLTWDIEMSSKTGKFDNNALEPLNNIICIGCSFIDYCKKQKEIIKFCITYLPCSPHSDQQKDTRLIMVADEREMLLQFAKCINILNPALVTGFNDFNFDWPFVRGRLQFFGITKQFRDISSPTFVLETGQQTLFGQVDIKINASDKKTGQYPMIPGIIFADTRIILIKNQKIEKKSLNEYLKANGLPVKLDVDFKDMNNCFRRYLNQDEITKSECNLMYHIMNYCAHDADCCRLLWEKRNIIQQQLQMANFSYTPLSYAFNRADGIKVRNMVAYFANQQHFSMPMSNTSSDQRWRDTQLIDKFEKYPGAYVPAPKKGINTTPVIALDFASLYPSIIMAHNLSPENVVVDVKGVLIQQEQSQFQPESITDIIVPFENDTESDQIQGIVVRDTHQTGLYPTILRDLFNKRKQVKNQIEKLEQLRSLCAQNQDVMQLLLTQFESIQGLFTQESRKILSKDDINFQISLLDAQQYALKVYMNTFYGETGNKKSPFFDLIVAGGTTTLGRKYIMMVHEMVAKSDCEVVYGDTDSIYLRPRLSHYKFKQTANTYEMISQALEIATQIRDTINETVGIQTGNVLKMEFEEVLCPSLFMGKKKYCGVKHKSVPMHSKIDQSDILIKGIDFIKSQYPVIVKTAGYNLLTDLMQSFADYDLRMDSNKLKYIFRDQSRVDHNKILLNRILDSVTKFRQHIRTITPDNYDCLATRKKIRGGKKSGEMSLFNDRFKDNKDIIQLVEDLRNQNGIQKQTLKNMINIDPKQLKARIDPTELQQLGIELPQEGEIIDIVYLESFSGAKASQKMHLLQFAKLKQMPINMIEYEMMFITSAKRLLVCYFGDQCDEKTSLKNAESIIIDQINQQKNNDVVLSDYNIDQYLQQMDQTVNFHVTELLKQAKILFNSVTNITEKVKQKSKQRHDDLQKELELLLTQKSCLRSFLVMYCYKKRFRDIYSSVNPDIQMSLLDIISEINDNIRQNDVEMSLELIANCAVMDSITNNAKSITANMIQKKINSMIQCIMV